MHANNETGTLQPVAECAAVARAAGVPVHTDAAQSAGKIAVDVDALGVDGLSLAGHKLYAPKGVGALYLRDRLGLEPLIHGAGHERGRRAGTESLMLAEALSAACDLARELPGVETMAELRDHFWQRLEHDLGDAVVRNGRAISTRTPVITTRATGRRGAGKGDARIGSRRRGPPN